MALPTYGDIAEQIAVELGKDPDEPDYNAMLVVFLAEGITYIWNQLCWYFGRENEEIVVEDGVSEYPLTFYHSDVICMQILETGQEVIYKPIEAIISDNDPLTRAADLEILEGEDPEVIDPHIGYPTTWHMKGLDLSTPSTSPMVSVFRLHPVPVLGDDDVMTLLVVCNKRLAVQPIAGNNLPVSFEFFAPLRYYGLMRAYSADQDQANADRYGKLLSDTLAGMIPRYALENPERIRTRKTQNQGVGKEVEVGT